ncbi:sensor histidine kinase [Paenibacillus sp. GCM10027626]|uniref:sensor histidine kinase n=1 Tax=Paenibacillus sp. GCM10027626 TaxID=3273411 RepID=UPI00363E47E7
MERTASPGWKRVVWPDTLRGRLSILLVVVTITPIVLIGVTSYYWMLKVQTEKISANYQSMADAKTSALEKTAANLGSVSQLLVIDGGLGDDVITYLTTDDPVLKIGTFLSIDKSLTNIIYSNPGINGLYFSIPGYESNYQFESAPIKPELSSSRVEPQSKDVLYRANQLTFHGPHESALAGHDETVISLTRVIEYGAGRRYYVYLESKFEDIIHSVPPIGEESLNVLVREDGMIRYSDHPEILAVGSTLNNETLTGRYKQFSAESRDGWKLMSLIDMHDFRKELRQWQRQFLLVAAISILVTILAASFIWRMVYYPLQRINREIKRFSYDQTHHNMLVTQLQEFDMLFASFQSMRIKIVELITEVEQKEKRRGELEVEKLMSQINPHFLHNSLNTIQWLARANGQTEIYNLVKVFTRVLHYNLSKGSMIVTIKEELKALHDYIELQNIRYDHRFNVTVDCDSSLTEVPIPRFVLQPLVENALYHGLLSEKGDIRVEIRSGEPSCVSITVADNGKGMTPERVAELLAEGSSGNSSNNGKTGLGIGLNYVRKMLNVHYSHRAQMTIDSMLGAGTRIRIVIPFAMEGDERND